MPRHGCLRRRIPVGAAAIAVAALASAVHGFAAGTAPADVRGDDEIRIREVFSSHLPDTMRESLFRASVYPHFGDLGGHDYFRVSTFLRYGLTSHLEISTGTSFYTSHGLGSVGIFRHSGILAVELGAKLNVGQAILDGWDSAIGFDAVFPTGRPPAEVTDGLDHIAPYVTFSRRLVSYPRFRLFWGSGFDAVRRTDIQGEIRKNQFDDSSLRASAGFVYDRNLLHYSFETRVGTTRWIGGANEDVIEFRPGVIWEIPRWNDRRTRSGWMFGLGTSVSFGPDGTDFGVSGKLRFNFDIKRLLGRSESKQAR